MNSFLFSGDFSVSILHFFICIAVNWFIVEYMYFKKSKRKSYYFTFILMTVSIFFLVFFMKNLDKGKATLGVGLGLFAIFSIMRFRTDTMPVREMTYLFVLLTLSVIHSLAVNFVELIIVDFFVVSIIWLCERKLIISPVKLIQYDRIDLIRPECREDLVKDIENRTGLKVIDLQIGAIDFLRDMAIIRVSYEGDDNDVNNIRKIDISECAE